jgi:outer membrane protein TolC
MKIKSSAFICAFIFFMNTAWAQKVDYNKIIVPETLAGLSIEERLVQLAWQNNPWSDMVKNNLAFAQYGLKAIKTDWGTQFGVNGNLNEFTIKSFNAGEDPLSRSNFYPRYNVYVHLPLSSFIQRPNQRRAAETRVAYAKDEVNLKKLEIRARVLKLYAQYKQNKDVYHIRLSAQEEESDLFNLIESKFKSNQITVQEYLQASKARTEQKVQVALAKSLFDQSVLDLEEVIGVPLDDVIMK